ncbi:MAG: ABC-F family ATP-binding cassette domain-containing protein [Sphaerochaetaceae bacterium]|nr:ABC-F family ATP-binding cassette domain-containing protein [Sphaerochaetaceae bacterium]
MNVLSLENVSKTLKDEPLFEEVTLGLECGDRVGLIGRNGTGKSTFLRLIKGDYETDTGTMARSRDMELVMLDQQVTWNGDATVRSYLHQGQGKRIQLVKEYQNCLGEYRHAPDSPSVSTTLSLLTERMDKEDGWNLENDYQSLLSELALEDGIIDRKMSQLSGGMQKKIAIARALAAKPTMLLLDEPTNHLDIPTIEWLERYLTDSQMTIIVVTHDRYFLNHICTSILELDRGRMYLHPGSFAAYLERKAQRLEAMQKEQDRITTVLRRELQWLQRGPKARTGKDSGRKARIQQLLDSRHKVTDEPQAAFTSTARRMGKKILEVDSVSKSYGGHKVIEDFSFSFIKGQRIGIVGPNGSGKSTLLDILTSHVVPDCGTVDTGINTVFGYYDQLGRNLTSDKGVLEYMQDISERITLAPGQEVTAARFLEIFGFPSSFHRLPISVLSGGERRRLYLISRLIRNPNFLVLDEPTNDLDLDTMQRLEQYVLDFEGCVLAVSHDRAFLDCTCEQLFILDGTGAVHSYAGTFSEYRQDYEQEGMLGASAVLHRQKNASLEPECTQNSQVHAEQPRQRTKKGLSYKEQKELDSLTEEIERLEDEQSRLESSFATAEPTGDGTLRERTERYEAVQRLLAQKNTRWEELADMA